jgi:hypothetical protein
MFTTPEFEIISQDEPGDDMFFIIKGDCIVDMIDYDNKKHEIAILHKCARSCSVISRNYNTFARLTKDGLRMIFHDYPSLKALMLAHIHTYHDPKKKFLLKIIKNIDYLKHLSKETLHQLVSQMNPLFFETGQIVAKEMTNADHILIVVNGSCELYTEFEGNEFVIERVYKGGIINSRSFLMADVNYCNIRATQNTRILQLSLKIVDEMKQNFADFEKSITME